MPVFVPTMTNPRAEAFIPNWPMGGSKRGTARFYVESDAKGRQRACRTTTPDGISRWSNPKKMTYSDAMVVADGSDGRTYILDLTYSSGSPRVYVRDSAFMSFAVVWKDNKAEAEQYAALLALIQQVWPDKNASFL